MDENTRLRNSGLSDAAIARMTQNERYEALVRLENAPSPDATAGAAAGATGLALVGALVLGRRREGDGDTVTESDPFSDSDSDNLVAENRRGDSIFGDMRYPQSLGDVVPAYYNPLDDPAYQPRNNIQSFSVAVQRMDPTQILNTMARSSELPSGTKLKLVGNSPIIRKQITEMVDGPKPIIGKENTIKILNESLNQKIVELSQSPLRSEEIKNVQRKIDTVKESIFLSSQKVPKNATELNALQKKLNGYQVELNLAVSADVGRQSARDPEFENLVKTDAQIKADQELAKAQNDLTGFYLSESRTSDQFLAREQLMQNMVRDAELAKAKADASTEQRLSLLVKERDPMTGNIRLDTLRSVSSGLVETGRVPQMKTETFRVFQDEAGNPHLIPRDGRVIDAISLQRANQEVAFHKQVEAINQTGSGYVIKPETGMIERNANGERIEPNDFAGRQEAFKQLKASLGSAFDPKTNPNHAKLEAVNNFAEVRNENGKLEHFETSINGIKIKTLNAKADLNYQSIQASNGSTWLDVTNAAGSVGATEVSINSIIKPGAHANGFALDVGSITIKNDSKETTVLSIRYKDGTPNTIATEPPAELKTFLDKIKNSAGTTFYATPWEVRMNGQVYENKFSAVRPELWGIGNLDPSNKEITPEIENEIYTTIAEAAGLDPIKNKDIIKQMWNHRHHLHVSEVGSPDVH